MGITPIGILGGTFDPVHNGHLRLAQEALEQCRLSAVRFVPAGIPPHRAPHARAGQRLEMVRLALEGNPAFILDEREVRRGGPCYTAETLVSMRKEFGAAQPLCLLLGCDAFLRLNTWYEWRHLFELAHVVVMQRAGGRPLGNAIGEADAALRKEYQDRLAPGPRALHDSASGAILVTTMPALEISSTDIRKRRAEKKNIRYLLPDAVADYIHSHNLYT